MRIHNIYVHGDKKNICENDERIALVLMLQPIDFQITGLCIFLRLTCAVDTH